MNMNTFNKFSIFAIAAFAILYGCSNTADGMKEDTEANAESTAKAAQDAGKGMSESGQAVEAATLLTPKIKLAIAADTLLNDSKNLIDVTSTKDMVTLEGHVTGNDLKVLAGKIAQKVLTENNASQPLENKLEVKP
jgi:osmotically-inducible protein OsmY